MSSPRVLGCAIYLLYYYKFIYGADDIPPITITSPDTILKIEAPELTKTSYTYLPSDKVLVTVEPNDNLNSPPLALVNPTSKVANACCDDPIAILFASCAEPVQSVTAAVPIATALSDEKSKAVPDVPTTV